MKKILIWIAPVALVVIFLFLSEGSFSKSLNRDLFPDGCPEYLDCGPIFHDKSITWMLLGSSSSSCRVWVTSKNWSERVAWRKSYANPKDPERMFLDIIFKEHKIASTEVNTIYSGLVDGSDVGYLIILDNPINEKYYGIVCVLRS